MKQDFIVRHCQECGRKFVTGNRTQRFCCEKCNAAFYFQIRKKMQAYLSQVEDDPASKTYFTITETSDILGVSVSTVYRLLKSRKLYAERLSEKETLVSLKSIESYKAYLKSDEILAQHNAYTIHDLMELAEGIVSFAAKLETNYENNEYIYLMESITSSFLPFFSVDEV